MAVTFFKKTYLKALFVLAALLFVFAHPIYVSVTDIKYNEKKNSLEISCKMFTNDLEDALKKTSKKNIDILNPKDRKEVESVLFDYIKKRLTIKVNNKPANYTFIGYEKEEESIWVYLEFKNVQKPKLISIDNKLLYDFLKEQINLVNAQVGDKKQNYKLSNPDGVVKFEFK